MSDAWNDLQEFKNKQNSRREKLQRRKIEREGLVFGITADTNTGPTTTGNAVTGRSNSPAPIQVSLSAKPSDIKLEPEIEQKLLACLCDASIDFPVHSRALTSSVSKLLNRDVQDASVEILLQKFAAQELICIKEGASPEGKACIVIITAEHNKLVAFANEVAGNQLEEEITSNKRKRKSVSPEKDEPTPREVKKPVTNFKSDESIENLLSLPSTREKETKKMGEEILDLLSKPTAKERSLVEKFKSQGGAQVQEFCPHGIKEECMKMNQSLASCRKLHFKKILQKHTDESLGDCSFLNTCFHMDTCKYVHYEVDYSGSSLYGDKSQRLEKTDIINSSGEDNTMKLYPPQWIQCDLRFFDMSILGKFAVVMADPPWDIHMELPYGTMSDDEMRQLAIPSLQEEGLIFLWVTGRAMELGRECLKLWGYDRCDELIWVKTNQLQRIIRTGRTGHWLNHGKEHCLVGMKGDPSTINRGLDCDVIVAEVRATSHKPDEIYGIIERLSPGTRKIELFGRPHNVQPNWITLGNQLDGVKLLDPDLIKRFKKHFPDGNCMKPPKKQ